MRSYLRCFLLLLLPWQAFGQNYTLDSLKQQLERAGTDSFRMVLLEELAWYSYDYDPQQSKQYASHELQLAQKLNDRQYEAYAINNLAAYYEATEHIDSAILLQKRVLAIGMETNSDRTIASSYNNLGTYYYKIDSYDSAMQYYLRALKIYERLDNQAGTAKCLNNVGGVLASQKNQEQALSYYFKAFVINKQLNDSTEIAINLLNIGLMNEELSRLDSAKKYFDRTLEVCRAGGIRTTEMIVLTSLGDLLFYEKKYQQAIDYYNQSLALAIETDTRDRQAEVLVNMGRAYSMMGDNVQAEKKFLRGLALAREIKALTFARKSYKGLYEMYENTNALEKAIAYHHLYSDLNDSIFNQEQSNGINELNIQYETARKEQQIKLNEAQIETLHQQAKADELRGYLLGTGLIAVLLVGGIGIFGYRQRLRRHQVERRIEKESFEKELSFKKKELATHTLHLVQKSELLESIRTKLEEVKKEPNANPNAIARLIQIIRNDEQSEKDWANFQTYFEQVHEKFDIKLREHFNDLTNNEVRLAALLKMSLSTKEIATILNISPDSVNKARYRLRKKLNLSTEESLETFLLAL